MNFIRGLDAWIGKTLMHPPIILICQLTRISQHAFNRYLWWIVALHALWQDDHQRIAYTVFFILFALARTLSAARDPDRESRSALVLRVFFWSSLAASIVALFLRHPLDGADLDTLLALFAEYAATIRTIPPRSVKKPRRDGANQRAEARSGV